MQRRVSKDRNRIVHLFRPLLRNSSLNLIACRRGTCVLAPCVAHAEALLVIEADTGKVLQAENATYPWYPASVTKLMTAYVTLKAVKDGRITLDTLLTVSPVAASQSPSKMGFRPGTQVTVDNALKMMLVKSANDMAVVLAEGVGGSIDGFSAQMNETAQKLGMTQTSYVNPNGLPADGQITSARDLAILARAIIHDLPEYEYFVHIPSIRFGRRITQNFNRLIGRYPGADGFKTGFICASGYNLVASATRDGKRLIAVVLGASSGTHARGARRPTARSRLCQQLLVLAAALARHGRQPGADRRLAAEPARRNVRRQAQAAGQRRGRGDGCEQRRRRRVGGESGATFFASGLQPPMPKPSELLAQAPAPSEPILVYTGPTRSGAALIAAVAADSDSRRGQARGKRKNRTSRPRSRTLRRSRKPREAEPSPTRSQEQPACGQACHAKPDARRSRPWPAAAAESPRRPRRPPSRRRGERQSSRAPKPASQASPDDERASRRLTATHQTASSAASISRGRLAMGGGMLNAAQNSPPAARNGTKAEGNYHGANLAQAISGRRARRYRRHPICVAGRVAGRKLCEVRRPQGLHLHGQVDQLSRSRRDVEGARRLSAEQGPAKGRARRADDAERAAISHRHRRRAARRLCGRQRQSALHPARARAPAQGFRR